MSNAHVSLNGKEIGLRPYGYNSFTVDTKGVVKPGTNELVVELENKERASRWYPGAGLYRNVHVINTARVHIPVWGTYITTPKVTGDYASVHLRMKIDGAKKGEQVTVNTDIIDPEGKVVANDKSVYYAHGRNLLRISS